MNRMYRAFASRAAGMVFVVGWLLGCSGAERNVRTAEHDRSESRKCDGVLPPLPEPAVWKVPWPELTPEQRRKKDEVEQDKARWICEEGWRIVAVTQYDAGDFIYWVDPYSMGADAFPQPHGALPPPEPLPLKQIWMKRFAGYILEDTKATSFKEWLKQGDIPSAPPSVYQGPSKPR